MSAPHHKKGGSQCGIVTAALLALMILSVVDLVHAVECPATLQFFGYPNRCTGVHQQLYYGRPPDYNGCGASWFSWLGDIATSANGLRCCRAHDLCYSTAGTPMGLCNEEFAACLVEHTSIGTTAAMAGLVNLVCPSAYAPAQNDYLACTNHLGEVGYVGCFQDSSSSRVWAYQHKVPTFSLLSSQREFTVQSCRTECASRRFTYAGLQDGNECWCGNSVPAATKLADSMCNKPCVNDNMQLCGGYFTMSVYKTGYMGCFADQSVRDLPYQMSSTPLMNFGFVFDTGYVPVTCMAECHSKGYRYAAVQSGGYCFCGNTYGGYGPLAASSCQMDCRAVLETATNGRVPMYCGGGWANQIYDTQITLSGFKPYSFAIKTSPNGDAGKCLEWNSQAGPSIPNLTAQTCSLNAGQQFITSNDGYIRPLTDNAKCIDAADGLSVGSTFKVSTCSYNGNQRWRRNGNSFMSMDNNSLCMQINHNGWGSVATVQSCSSAVQEQVWKSLGGDTINFDLTVKNNYVGSKDIFPVSSKDEVWVDVNPATNYAVGRGISWACSIKTTYSKIRLDRTTMRIDTSRREYTTTEVLSGDNCGTTASVPYGVAASCTGGGEVMSSIDLRGTPYRVISPFVTSGYAAHGSYTTGDGIQISIYGGGYCGWQSTPESNALGEESAIIFGGKHIYVDVVGTEFPRQSGITDPGYDYLTRGWYDIQRIGKYNDYCRYVGWPDRRFSCALAGSTNEFVLDNVDPSSLGHLALAQTECAILYADSNFAGDILTFQSGTYNSNFGSFNDKASSLKVAPGCTVSLYSDANKGGSVSHFKNDVPFLTFQNDIFSSGECWC